MKKREKFSLLYFLGLLAFIFGIQLLFFPDRSGNRELTYNEFLSALEKGKGLRVVVFEDKIIGQFKEEANAAKNSLTDAPSTPWRLRVPAIESQIQRQFIVSRIPGVVDDSLLPKLLEAKVDFMGRFETNTLRNFFLNWIVPIAFFSILWGIIFRRMSGSHPMLDLGRNKARIQAENPKNPVTFSDVAGEAHVPFLFSYDISTSVK